MSEPHRQKIMLVFGTRPEAIKMGPLFHALSARREHFDPILCVTGQHRQMLDQTLAVFGLSPSIDLDIMQPGQDLFDITSSVLLGMRGALAAIKPSIVLVHGDTTTTLATAMAAFYQGIPVGHVEAGLRTHDLSAPFPEELNRQLTSKLATWHFAPTTQSAANLKSEGVPDESVVVTGNTVIDALFWVLQRIDLDSGLRQGIEQQLDGHLRFDWRSERFVLITGHRRENFGHGFLEICRAVRDLAERYPAVRFVYPVHLNPNVQAPVREVLENCENVILVPPLEYEPFAYLLKHCDFVLTDSGGIQEEGPSLGKPVLVMRNTTERPEAISAGTVRLVGADHQRICDNVAELIDNRSVHSAMSRAHNPYGDGNACQRIVDFLEGI